jgi:hypothetical protein
MSSVLLVVVLLLFRFYCGTHSNIVIFVVDFNPCVGIAILLSALQLFLQNSQHQFFTGISSSLNSIIFMEQTSIRNTLIS